MIITTEGIIIRTPVSAIPVLSKTTSGVKLINIDKESDAKVASFTVVTEESEDEEDNASSEEAPSDSEE